MQILRWSDGLHLLRQIVISRIQRWDDARFVVLPFRCLRLFIPRTKSHYILSISLRGEQKLIPTKKKKQKNKSNLAQQKRS